MPDEAKSVLSSERLMEIGSLTPPHATKEEWIEILRLAHLGHRRDSAPDPKTEGAIEEQLVGRDETLPLDLRD